MDMTISPLQINRDHVTRNEFGEFKGEMRSFRFGFDDFKDEMYVFKNDMYKFRNEMYIFRDNTNLRFDGIDKRLDSMSKNLSDLRNEIPHQMGVLRDGFRDDLRIVVDQVKALGEKIDIINSKIS